jgi:two-component system chemotaxis sensor kinase CheA
VTSGPLSEATLAPIRAGFFLECEDLLGELEAGLLAMQDEACDQQIVDAVFRAVHSIKGGAGAFGLNRLVGFAHALESALDAVRSKTVALDPKLLRLLLRAADLLADLVRTARDGAEDDGPLQAEIEPLAAALAELASTPGAEDEPADAFDDFDFTPTPVTLNLPETERVWTIRLRPHASLYARANEPLLLIRGLNSLGVTSVGLDDSALPALADLQPEEAYLAWTIELTTNAEEEAIREVFAFVDEDCDVSVECQADLEHTSPAAAPLIESAEPFAAPAPRSAPAAGSTHSIRVDLERVDRLINLVGELVINQSMLMQRFGAVRLSAPGMEAPLDELDHLTRDIQESVMAIRAQPVKAVFQRLSRLVREVGEATGKSVRLVVSGEDTEVDRTVIERLSDPLTHMIRNAIDHGLESPAKRMAAGKPETGVVRVSAAHRGGRIVVEVADDGRGIDRPTVRETAIRRGLILADAVLSDDEIDNLIFAPGFSTATELSAVSGRGVGMDVVKSSVQDLGGRIGVTSRPGEGSRFTLSLPLTLAVLDGMVVSVAGHSLIAPLTSLIKSVQPGPADVRRLGATTCLLSFRGEHLPLIDLGLTLGYRPMAMEPTLGVILVVEDDLGRRAALLVDEILGQRQVVIKSLEANYRAVPGVAAATILGDGRVALILDVSAIVDVGSSGVADPPLRFATG